MWPLINRSSPIFLQVVIALIAIGALALLLWEPQIEGVNAHATNFETYFDFFILLVYAGSIPFFFALYQAFKLLGYARQNKIFSGTAVNALRTIKYCALAVIGFVVMEEMFIMLNHRSDDPAGAVFIGVLITFGSVVSAAAAAMFEQILQSAVDMKSRLT